MKRLCLRTVRPTWHVNLCKARCFLPRVAVSPTKRSADLLLTHPLDFAQHNNDFGRVLLEQRVIVAEMLPSDRLVGVRGLYEERESADEERI